MTGRRPKLGRFLRRHPEDFCTASAITRRRWTSSELVQCIALIAIHTFLAMLLVVRFWVAMRRVTVLNRVHPS